jgi:response regulator of citrate/malate metabolism
MKINKLTDLIPFFNEQGLTVKQIAKLTRKSEPTIFRYLKQLRDAGYEVKTDNGKVGRPKIKLD